MNGETIAFARCFQVQSSIEGNFWFITFSKDQKVKAKIWLWISVTRWLDYLLNIWPFKTMENWPNVTNWVQFQNNRKHFQSLKEFNKSRKNRQIWSRCFGGFWSQKDLGFGMIIFSSFRMSLTLLVWSLHTSLHQLTT